MRKKIEKESEEIGVVSAMRKVKKKIMGLKKIYVVFVLPFYFFFNLFLICLFLKKIIIN